MKNTPPLISIIMPTFNCEKYLNRSISSVLNQTFKDFELIIIDDGSTDNTRELIETLKQTDCRIKYFFKQNGGVSSARNLGLEVAIGDYITFLDADDEMYNNCLEVLYSAMQKYNADYIVSQISPIKDGKLNENFSLFNEVSIGSSKDEAFVTKMLKYLAMSVVYGKLYPRKLIQQIKFDEDLKYHEDNHFLFRYVTLIDKIAIIPDRTIIYHCFERDDSLINLSRIDHDIEFKIKYAEKMFKLTKAAYPNNKYLCSNICFTIISNIIYGFKTMHNAKIDKNIIMDKINYFVNNDTINKITTYSIPRYSYQILIKSAILNKDSNAIYEFINTYELIL